MSTHRRTALYWQNRNHPISLESEDKIKKKKRLKMLKDGNTSMTESLLRKMVWHTYHL